MLLPGEAPLKDGERPSANATQCAGESRAELLSPSIQRTVGEQMAAFEMKFLIHDSVAARVESWAVDAMQRDAFADLANGGAYQTTTLYLDTPQHDVFHRAKGFRASKFRLRRYGSEPRIYLERKTRQGDRVSKRRCDVPMCEMETLSKGALDEAWPGAWFHERVLGFPLQPSCRLTYDRTAFVKLTDDGPVRMTLDRRIRGLMAGAWDLTPLDAGHGILPEHVICEFKFRGTMPGLFKEVIHTLQLEAGSVSKYRRMMLAAGMTPSEAAAAELTPADLSASDLPPDEGSPLDGKPNGDRLHA